MIRLLSRLYLANSYWRRSNCCPRNTTPSPWRSNMAAHGRHSILSSMPLQVLFYLNSWYFSAFFIAEILMFIYKGSKGNLCERSLMLIVSVGVLVPCTVLSVYYLLLQTFILRLEFILNAILLCFYALELVLALITIAVFSRASVY
ncbi:transmembrane protein 216 isoform X2 [Tachysurus fulvidraco]|uniref:transmembrane protein 216 isoform X2 n=1 Tax=Tachysurus fulvidraco TaxID=1234273 RepID=UPI001FEDCEA5|nr:transmembrane protein 216 isoform X2 [Tachysurus fulvidraco]